MSSAWQALADGSLSRAASIVQDMVPILAVVGGLSVGAWIASFLLSVAKGGN